MLSNAYFLAKFRFDTAENEQHFAEFLPTDALCRGEVASLALPGGPSLGLVVLPLVRSGPGGGPQLRPGAASYFMGN